MKSRKIKYTYSRAWRKAPRRSLRPTLGRSKGTRNAEFSVEESSPSQFQHEKKIAIHMADMPIIQRSSSPEASSRRILHALTPTPFDYTQYMESPLDEWKPFDTQDDYSIFPPSTPLCMRPDFNQGDSNGPEFDAPQHKSRFSDIEGCDKIEKDCQAGNLPANVSNRAKYLWKILSQAAADFDCLRLDETMDELPAVLVACCIYIACQQCKIPRTFIAIRMLTETSSLKFRQSVRKSFQIIQKYIDETKCSCFRAFRVPSEGCCQICHRLYKENVVSGTSESLAFCSECSGAYHMSCAKSLNATIATPNSSGLICRRCVPCIIHPDVEQNTGKPIEKALAATRNSVSFKPSDGGKIRKTSKLRDDQCKTSEVVKEELKANSIDSKMVKWLMKRCRDLQKRQDENIAKFLASVQHDFLAQIEVAEDETIRLLKGNYRAPRMKLSKAQEAYLAALQTNFLQSNLQSNLQSFLAGLQQTNNKKNALKRDRGINEPSDEAFKEFEIALVSRHSKSGTGSSADYADSSSKPKERDFPQHFQATSTGTQRSERYDIDSELEEGEIEEYPELKFQKRKTLMRPSQQKKARRTRLVMRGKMT